MNNGQLTKNQLFAERTEIFQKMLEIEVKPQPPQPQQQSKPTTNKPLLPNMEGLTKTQKKNLKKKLKKQKKREK